jgi:hypothetical protein
LPIGIAPAEIRAMPQAFCKTTGTLKSVIAGLMAALVLLLSLFAASARLHRELHANSGDHHNGPCAACRVAEGQVDVPVTAAWEILAPVSVLWTVPRPEEPAPQSVDFSVASSRGPPVLVSFL